MFDDVLKDNRDLIIKSIQDDITIESKKDLFIDVRVSIPFGAYYFLVLFILFGSEKKSLMRWMHAYNLVLFIISSLLVWLLLSGSYWVAPVINAHEIAYKALFVLRYDHICKRNEKCATWDVYFFQSLYGLVIRFML